MIEFKREENAEKSIRSEDGTTWIVSKELAQVQLIGCNPQGKRNKCIQKVMDSKKFSEQTKEKLKTLFRYNPSELSGFSLSISEFAQLYMSDDFKISPNEAQEKDAKDNLLINQASKHYIIPLKRKADLLEQDETATKQDKDVETKKMKIS